MVTVIYHIKRWGNEKITMGFGCNINTDNGWWVHTGAEDLGYAENGTGDAGHTVWFLL